MADVSAAHAMVLLFERRGEAIVWIGQTFYYAGKGFYRTTFT